MHVVMDNFVSVAYWSCLDHFEVGHTNDLKEFLTKAEYFNIFHVAAGGLAPDGDTKSILETHLETFKTKVEKQWMFKLGESKEQPIDSKHENSLDKVREFLNTYRIQFPDLEEEPYDVALSKEASSLRNSTLLAPVPTHTLGVLLHLLVGVLLHLQNGAAFAERSLTPVAQRSLTRVTAERSLTPFPSWLGTWAQGCKWPVL